MPAPDDVKGLLTDPAIRHSSEGGRMNAAEVRKIAVIGAGTMGAGIAQTCSAAGFEVAMRDIDQRLVDGGFRRIRDPLMKRVEKGKMTQAEVDALIAKIHGTVDLRDALEGAQVVIEAVFEKMEVKREIYAEMDRLASPEVVFASNTSSLSITEMANVTKRADRVVGMHFFNPAPVMKLVEVIRGSETSDATVALARGLCVRLGKEAVEVKESPGFVVNRLLVPMMNEAFNLLMEGVASPEDIDKAMKLGTNMPMGPFELADYTGIDIGLDVMEVLFRETGDPKFRPSPLLRKYVRAGRLGKKTGRGVYDYTKG
jgi:3-hydroxybutyryl-CoA dehydrogenase